MLGKNRHAKARMLGFSRSNEDMYKIRGVIDAFEIGKENRISSIIFHVPNFIDHDGQNVRNEQGTAVWTSRVVIEADEWRINIDMREETSRLFSEVRATAGFAIRLMKHSGPPITANRDKRPLSFLDFIRFAAILTVCVLPIVILPAALLASKSLDHAVWGIGIFLVLFPIWVGTLTVGCLVMIPVWIWRRWNRPTGKSGAETTPQKQLWDQWMDGPYPCKSE